MTCDSRADPESEILMGRAIRQDSQDELHLLPIQKAQVNIDRIILPFIDLVPLSQRFNISVPDLVFEFEDHIAVIGFLRTADQCLEMVTGLDVDG